MHCSRRQALQGRRDPVSIHELAEATAMKPDDIVFTLQHLNLVKYYKVRALACRASSHPPQGQHCLAITPEVLQVCARRIGLVHTCPQAHAKSMAKRKLRIAPEAIEFTPIDWVKRGAW